MQLGAELHGLLMSHPHSIPLIQLPYQSLWNNVQSQRRSQAKPAHSLARGTFDIWVNMSPFTSDHHFIS